MGSGPHHVERFTATKVFAVALSLVVAVYGFVGWVNASEWFKAILCLLAQGLAINAAIAARRAFAKEKQGLGVLGLLFTAGFAYGSEQGLHHAWTADGSQISPALTWFLCASEPILFWFTESVQLAKKPVSPEEAAEAALAEMRAAPKGEPVQRRAGFRSIAGGLGGAAVAATPSAGQAVEPGPSTTPPLEDTPMVQRLTKTELRSFEPDRATAKIMLRTGATAYAVHKATGVPLSTCKRWARAA